MAAFDVILRGGEIIDGSGREPYTDDIGLQNGVISLIGDLSSATADEHLSLDGLVIAPGFIDTHTHTDLTCFQGDDLATTSILQGVTTEVCGNCGFSPFPFTPGRQADVEQHIDAILGPQAFVDLPSWKASVEARGLYANLLPLVGHGTVRTAVLGARRRSARSEDIKAMTSLIRQTLDQGAAGLSSGLIYTPGTFATTAEIIELCRRSLVGSGRPYVSHVRGETQMVAEAVTEAISIGRDAAVPVHISHHKVAGRENWGRSEETLALISHARKQGIDVTLDVYPYEAASTLLYSLLPPWVQAGGRKKLLERVAQQSVRERLQYEIENGIVGWENIPRAAGWDRIVVASSTTREFEGRSIADLAAEASRSPLDLVCDLLRATEGQVIAVLHLMAESDVSNILAYEATMVGSDGLPLPGKPHPRVAGTFARVLGRYSRSDRLLTLSEAVRKMTALPAERFGLSDRGAIIAGKAADLVVFSPAQVLDRATYAEPLLTPAGIEAVFVSGRLAVSGGKLTGLRPGRVLSVG